LFLSTDESGRGSGTTRAGASCAGGNEGTEFLVKAPIAKTEFVDFHAKAQYAGAAIGTVLGWDPQTQNLKVLSPWSSWGERGMATFTRAAADGGRLPGLKRDVLY